MPLKLRCWLPAILMAVAISPSHGQEWGVPRPYPYQHGLNNHWSTQAGDSLIIDAVGAVRFVDRQGTLLGTARVVVECLKPSTNQGLQVVFVVLLTFSMDDTVSTVPGVLVSGEGDRGSLCLLGVPSPLMWNVRRWYGLGELDGLCLQGRQP